MATRRNATDVGPGRKALFAWVALAYLAALGHPCPPVAAEHASDPAFATVADAAAAHAAHAAQASLLGAWCGRPLAILSAHCPCGCEEVPASPASPLGYLLLLAAAPLVVPLAGAPALPAPPPRLPEPALDPIDHVPLIA